LRGGVVCFCVYKAGTFPGEGEGWGLSLKATGRDNGPQHLPPLLLCVSWGRRLVCFPVSLSWSIGASLHTCGLRTPHSFTRKGHVPTRPDTSRSGSRCFLLSLPVQSAAQAFSAPSSRHAAKLTEGTQKTCPSFPLLPLQEQHSWAGMLGGGVGGSYYPNPGEAAALIPAEVVRGGVGVGRTQVAKTSLAVIRLPDVLSKAPSLGGCGDPGSLQSLPGSSSRTAHGGLAPELQEVTQLWPVPWGPHLPPSHSPSFWATATTSL
jgi:hypothetical protein